MCKSVSWWQPLTLYVQFHPRIMNRKGRKPLNASSPQRFFMLTENEELGLLTYMIFIFYSYKEFL